MTDWIVRRWSRYGHDRLYAETPGGTGLGYVDLKTGRFHCDDLSNLPLLQEAVRDHLASMGAASILAPEGDPATGGRPPETPTGPIDAPAPAPAPPWRDLSANRPGAAAREQALAAREAQGRFQHVLARLLLVHTDERAWRIGADGEQAVADQLARLGPQWRVLHAVGVGDRGADIDHVVIGPAGVFTVNAKNHPDASVWVGGDTVMVNGRRVPYVRNSRHEARRSSRLLTEHAGFRVDVVGIVAVMGAHKGFTIKKQPEDGAVVVVKRKRISHHLQKRSARLSPREVDAIFEVARRSTT